MIPHHDLLPLLRQVDRRRQNAAYLDHLEWSLSGAVSGTGSAQQSPEHASSTPGLLSERECQVIALAATGLTNQAIAGRLFISEHTVKKHIANINRKLGTTNRVEAIRRARELRLV